MGRTCTLCAEPAAVEYELPAKWARLAAEEHDLTPPPEGPVSLQLCGPHLHEVHEIKERYEDRTASDFDDHEPVLEGIRDTLMAPPAEDFEMD